MLTNLKLALGLALALLVLGLTAWGWVEHNRANNLATQVQTLKIEKAAGVKALKARDKALARLKSTKERTDADLNQAIQAHPDWSTSPVPSDIACRVRLNPSDCSPE